MSTTLSLVLVGRARTPEHFEVGCGLSAHLTPREAFCRWLDSAGGDR